VKVRNRGLARRSGVFASLLGVVSGRMARNWCLLPGWPLLPGVGGPLRPIDRGGQTAEPGDAERTAPFCWRQGVIGVGASGRRVSAWTPTGGGQKTGGAGRRRIHGWSSGPGGSRASLEKKVNIGTPFKAGRDGGQLPAVGLGDRRFRRRTEIDDTPEAMSYSIPAARP